MAAISELGGRRLADDDRARGPQPRDGHRVGSRHVIAARERAMARRQSGHVDEILHAHGNAVQRAWSLAPLHGGIGRARGDERPLRIHMREGVDRRL